MSQDLILHLQPDGGVSWSIVERGTGRRLRQGQVSDHTSLEIDDRDAISRTLCLLPSEAVFVTRIALPTRSDRDAKQAIPFLIEDEIASSLEATEIIIGPCDDVGRRWVVAIDAELITLWRERLAAVLIRPVYTVPDCMVLDTTDVALALSGQDARILYRFADDDIHFEKSMGGSVDSSLQAHLLPALIQAVGDGEISVSGSLDMTGSNMTRPDTRDLDIMSSAMDEDRAKLWPALFGQRYTTRFEWQSSLRPLRHSAVLAGILFLSWCGLVLSEGLYLQNQAHRLESESMALVQDTFPDVTRRLVPAGARRLLSAKLTELGGGQSSTSFLLLVSALEELTENNDTILINHIRYDISQAELNVSALYSEFADFDTLSTDAVALNLVLDDRGTRESDRGIEGDFVLRLR